MITLKTFERTPSLSELKVTYKRGRGKKCGPLKKPFHVSGPRECAEYLRSLWDKDTIELREEFVLVCLNASLELNGWVKLHTGGLDSTPVDPRLVFGVALQTASAAIVVAHNHPTGSVRPSEEDEVMTLRLAAGAKLLGLHFLDHVIVTRDGYYSFAEAGRI
ncbi:MAG: JAB domain-containing protein [Gemmataceae bacterium]